MKLAQTKPTTRGDLLKALGEKNHVLRRYGRDVLGAVQAGVADTEAAPQPPKPVQRWSPGLPPYTRDDEPLLAALKNWRNSRCKAEKLGPGMIVNNALLKELSALKPKTVDDLEVLQDMRAWQRDQYGPPLVDFITGWLEKHPEAKARSGRKSSRRRGRGRRAEQNSQASGDETS